MYVPSRCPLTDQNVTNVIEAIMIRASAAPVPLGPARPSSKLCGPGPPGVAFCTHNLTIFKWAAAAAAAVAAAAEAAQHFFVG